MFIEELAQAGTSRGRIRVCLDNGTDFCLYKKEVDAYQLKEGMDLTEDDYQKILEEVLIPRATKRAMHLLEQMDRTEAGLRSKLSDSGYPIEAIDAAVSYVASFHYIDDERYCRAYIRTYQATRSKMRITTDLMQKGLDRELIRACLDEEYSDSEEELMRTLLRKKGYDAASSDRKMREKMYRFLASRGFSSSDIMRVLKDTEFD